jgi:hypothetical protein
MLLSCWFIGQPLIFVGYYVWMASFGVTALACAWSCVSIKH